MFGLVLTTLVIALLVLKIFALVDCVLRGKEHVRALPKTTWVIIILMVPVFGPLMWLLIGRGSRLNWGS